MTGPSAGTASVASLYQIDQDAEARALAARYAPILRFDKREPFLPLAAGYTLFRADADSPSFPRRITLHAPGKPPASLAIEYAIWWDWDIGHLYELEHVWVYVDARGAVVRGEASWHGDFHDMALDHALPLNGEHLQLYAEPGKHAFAPAPGPLEERAAKTRRLCARRAGNMGVHVTPLFRGKITCKSPRADQLVRTYLERDAFEPTFQFDQVVPLRAEMLTPWPTLEAWIPGRVAGWVEELDRTIPVEERRVLRIAHRGASAHAPENTLAAIVRAAEMNADMVELDIQVSAEGVPVIIHDSNLSRLERGKGNVWEYPLSELKKLDAGQGEQIPTLEEAIRGCLEQDLDPYLELKTGSAAPAIVALIRNYHAEGRTILTSFQTDWLADIRALAPEIPTSVLFHSIYLDPVALARAVGASYVHPAWESQAAEPHRLLSAEWRAQVAAAGLGIICWHEERPPEIAALKRLGVQGICSNAPELLL